MNGWIVLLFLVGVVDLILTAINYVQLSKLRTEPEVAAPETLNSLISISISRCINSFAVWSVALMGALFLATTAS